MGIIKAAAGAAKSVFKEQWKEYFSCDALGDDVLLKRGYKRTGKRSANKRKDDEVITNGSLLAVHDGQAVIIVSQGKVIDVCSEPGEHVFIDENHPGGVSGYFQDVITRIGFGGGDIQPLTHRIYYINTLEQTGNAFITPTPIPLRAGDSRIGISADLSLICSGVYSYRITEPAVFYRAVAGNAEYIYTGRRLRKLLDSLLLTCLQTTASQWYGEVSPRPASIPEILPELSEKLRETLTEETAKRYGILIVSVAFDAFYLADAGMIQELQAHAVLKDPQMTIAYLAGATAAAMQTAAATQTAAANGTKQ